MVLNKITIGQMRSSVVFKINIPTIAATTSREAITTGGQNDVYSNLITTRGRLRKKSGNRTLDLALLAGQDSYELICRFSTSINTEIQVNGKVLVDSIEYTIQSWEVVDQILHWYKFELASQSNTGSIINLGAELITNGGFAGNANGWVVPANWKYDVNKMTYSHNVSPVALSQAGVLVDGTVYRISFNITGLTGFLAVNFGTYAVGVFNYNNGDVSFDAVWHTSTSIIQFSPDHTFEGSITNVSVKEIL